MPLICFINIILSDSHLKFKLFSIFVYPDKNDYTRFILTRVTLPDPRERELIINNLTNNKNVFIDCGANSGFYSLDVSTKVKNVEKIMPEKITTPTVKRLASPGPDPIIKGVTPAIVDNEVIKIGLNLIFAASRIAFSISFPSERS